MNKKITQIILDMKHRIRYTSVVSRVVLFCLLMILTEAVYSESCHCTILLTRDALPFFVRSLM